MRLDKWLVLFCLAFPVAASADVTTGGVNWLDPLGYTKPAFYPLTLPTPGVNQYWVNLSGGSGSGCTSGTPCSWSSIAGKAGTTGSGGGAYIYIQGTGSMSDIVLNGTVGNEIVIRPRDDSTTATITGRNNWSAIKHYVVFDGGPNAQIRFLCTGCGQFDPVIYLSENANSTAIQNLTFYRTRWHVSASGMQFQSYAYFTNLYFINSEFDALGSSDTTNQHHIYMSQFGTGDGRLGTGFYVINCILRDTPGEAIEMRMAGTNSEINGGAITGSVFHDVGKGTCNNVSWKCRGAITMAEGDISNLLIANNLIWETGEGAMRNWSNDNTVLIRNNTIWNFGMGTPANSAWSSAAFSNAGFSGTVPGDFKNNLVLMSGNDANGNTKRVFNNNNNQGTFMGCPTGLNCGTSNQLISSATFASLDDTDPNFLKLVAASTPIDHGTAVCATTTDYFGTARPVNSTCDIGAQEFCSGGCGAVDTTFSTGDGRIIIRKKGSH